MKNKILFFLSISLAVLGLAVLQHLEAQPVRGRFGATFEDNDVLRAKVSGSHRFEGDDGSNLSLTHATVGEHPELQAKDGLNLEIKSGDGVDTHVGVDDLRIAPTSAPAYTTSTPAGLFWMTNATPDDTDRCPSCAAHTMHVFDADADVFQALW